MIVHSSSVISSNTKHQRRYRRLNAFLQPSNGVFASRPDREIRCLVRWLPIEVRALAFSLSPTNPPGVLIVSARLLLTLQFSPLIPSSKALIDQRRVIRTSHPGLTSMPGYFPSTSPLPSISPASIVPTADPATGEICFSASADRKANIVASLRGRAKWGLQARRRLSKLVLSENLRCFRGSEVGREDEIIFEEVIDVEFILNEEGGFKSVGVEASQMRVVRIEGVGHKEDPI